MKCQNCQNCKYHQNKPSRCYFNPFKGYMAARLEGVYVYVPRKGSCNNWDYK